MSDTSDLSELLANLSPQRIAGEFVFVSVISPPADVDVRAMVREDEGVTLILERSEADRAGLHYEIALAWITLSVASSLGAVGLTGAVSSALASTGISCNVVAGNHHDHLLVPAGRAVEALDVLQDLARESAARLGSGSG